MNGPYKAGEYSEYVYDADHVAICKAESQELAVSIAHVRDVGNFYNLEDAKRVAAGLPAAYISASGEPDLTEVGQGLPWGTPLYVVPPSVAVATIQQLAAEAGRNTRDCGEAGHDQSACGNKDCMPSLDPNKVQLCRRGEHSAEAQQRGQPCNCKDTCRLGRGELQVMEIMKMADAFADSKAERWSGRGRGAQDPEMWERDRRALQAALEKLLMAPLKQGAV